MSGWRIRFGKVTESSFPAKPAIANASRNPGNLKKFWIP